MLGENHTIFSSSFPQISVSKSADGTVSSELTIDRVSWNDGGSYSCLAREVNGDNVEPTKQDIELEIYGKWCQHYVNRCPVELNANFF